MRIIPLNLIDSPKKIVVRFVLIQDFGMYRHHLKFATVWFLVFVLLYYSVAWAVLQCSHAEGDMNHEVNVSETDPHDQHADLSVPRTHSFLDCTGPQYHTETLAGPSSPSELLHLTTNAALESDNFYSLASVAEHRALNPRFRTVFKTGSPLPQLSGASLYLSLSVFRI